MGAVALLTIAGIALGVHAGRTDAPPPAPVTVTTPTPPADEWSCEWDMGGVTQPDGTCLVEDEPITTEDEPWQTRTLV